MVVETVRRTDDVATAQRRRSDDVSGYDVAMTQRRRSDGDVATTQRRRSDGDAATTQRHVSGYDGRDDAVVVIRDLSVIVIDM